MAQEKKNRWSIVINVLLTTLTAILSAISQQQI